MPQGPGREIILDLMDRARPILAAGGPVPYAVCGPHVVPGAAKVYTEKEAAWAPIETAPALFERFIRGSW
jgi:hypothetical protein